MFHFARIVRSAMGARLHAVVFFEGGFINLFKLPRNLTIAMFHGRGAHSGPRIRQPLQSSQQQQQQQQQRQQQQPSPTKKAAHQSEPPPTTVQQRPQAPQPPKLPPLKMDGTFAQKPQQHPHQRLRAEPIKFDPKFMQKPLPKLNQPKFQPPKLETKMEEVILDTNTESSSKAKVGATIISTVTQTGTGKKSGDEGRRSDQENSWQTMKFTFTLFGVSFTGIGLFLLMELGKPKVNDEGVVVEDEYTGLPVAQQYVYRMMSQLDYYKRLINEPSREKLLPDELKYPYHQPPYTLVLELKDILVHPDWTYNTGWRFKKRPGIDQFLESLNGVYEIVIYTAELGMTVFPILEALDPNNLITYKLVRDATNFVEGRHVKDLDKLNRPLQKVILVDWDRDAIENNRDNVLTIPRWNGDDEDGALLDLANLLRVIAISEINDVREVLRYYKNYDDPLCAFRERQRELERTMYSKTNNQK